MATVSLCMIIKDEEAVLARCLESVRDCVDEIIIVDTGSSDESKKIAAGFTDKIYDFKWIDDFSAARNYSFSKGSMDDLMWLDADDVLLPGDAQKLRELKNSLPKDVNTVMMRYNTAFDENGEPTFFYYRERLIKRTAPHHWKGKVHEAIEYVGKVLYSSAAVTHRSVKKVYGDRNLRIYERQIESGESLSPRDRFYYGRELYYHKRYDEAVKVLDEYLSDGKGWAENNAEAAKIVSACRLAAGETKKALAVLSSTFSEGAPRADICCEIADIFFRSEDYKTASFWYSCALECPGNDESGGFIDKNCSGYIPCIQLCVCHYRMGDIEKSKRFNDLAGKYRPSSPQFLYNKKFFQSIDTLKETDKTDENKQ